MLVRLRGGVGERKNVGGRYKRFVSVVRGQFSDFDMFDTKCLIRRLSPENLRLRGQKTNRIDIYQRYTNDISTSASIWKGRTSKSYWSNTRTTTK